MKKRYIENRRLNVVFKKNKDITLKILYPKCEFKDFINFNYGDKVYYLYFQLLALKDEMNFKQIPLVICREFLYTIYKKKIYGTIMYEKFKGRKIFLTINDYAYSLNFIYHKKLFL